MAQPPTTQAPAAQGGAKKTKTVLQSKMVINTYITNAAETGDPEVLLETIGQHLASMNDINLATALHRVAKLSTRRDSKDLHLITASPLLKQLYDTVAQRIMGHGLRKGSGNAPSKGSLGTRNTEMPVQCMGVIAWSCAMMKLCDTELFGAISDIAAPRMHEFQPFELAQLLWSFAKISMPAPPLFEAAARRMLYRQEGEFKGLCLAMTAWAFAASHVRNEALYNSLSGEIIQHAGDLRPQELANTLWAFAEMQIHCPMLFETLGWAVSSKVKALKTQELTDVLWAFGAAGQSHPAVFAQASPVLSQKRGLLTPQNVASLAWAYVQLRAPELQQVLPSLLETAASKFSKFQARDLSTLLAAGMHAEMISAEYLGRLARHCSTKLLQETLHTMETCSLLNMLMVWSRANLTPPKLFDEAVQESSRRCPLLDVPALLETLRCALSVSLKPALVSRTGTAWIAAASDELARCVARLTTADVDTARIMLCEFCESPGVSAVLPLQIAMGYACSPALHPSFDSEKTVISTMCPSDYLTEERESVSKHLLSSALNPSEDDVWRSIRKQSIAKEKARAKPSDSKAASPVAHFKSAAPRGAMLSDATMASLVHVTSTALSGPMPRRETTNIISPASPGVMSSYEFTNITMDSLFVDEIPDNDAQAVTMQMEASSCALSDWLAQRSAQGSKMTCAQAARIALSVLSQADQAVAQLGSAALRSVRCDGVQLDEAMAPYLQIDAKAAAEARDAELSWLSPEEAVGSVDAQATWAALSYRMGLLLHCTAISGSPDPYPHRSADSVICGLLRAAKGCGGPEEPLGFGQPVAIGSPSRCSLMQNVISSCLRLSRPGPPDRRCVEASLAFLAQEANKLSV